jgi:CobQ-like glutamine amidotransferase family enzyme
MKLEICHLYADLMNTYGDDGNIITLINRCKWRGIEVEVTKVSLGQKINPAKFDFYFFGGGQDQAQELVAADLVSTNAKLLQIAVEKKAVVLAICGGYQLLGKYYQPKTGTRLKGAGLLDIHTIASDKRMIGNIVIKISQQLAIGHQPSASLVGFENHSGQTFLGPKAKPLGKILTGFGNNGNDKTEGAWQKTVFGCYLHGSVLPKNPHFADFLITLGLKRRYQNVKLASLDDNLEWQAHYAAIKRARQLKN